jgi:hypothetical protein
VESTYLGFRRLPAMWQGALVAAAMLVIANATAGRPAPFLYFQF